MENRPIQRLSDEVIGQIAAGEVVERPAAAVKELVENSIDAGATAVTVELRDGGVTYIRVSDNGRGIPAGQMRMAFERHATSKLTSADELFDVHTLGFRGEALASIAAVAKVVCTSRTEDAAFGVKAQVEAGAFVGVTEAASPVGTSIIVRDLFYNAPVRLKFLKKTTAEAALVSDYILRLILSRPDVAFRFVSQGKTVYRSAGDGTLDSAIYCVYGREALQAMRPVHGARYGALVDGFVGVGEQSRGNRQQQSFFINRRYFRDEGISKALESACEGYVMIGRYPVCALAIQLPFRQVDVNVHPNKLEVRFQNPEAVHRAVEELTREALRSVTLQEKLRGENTGVTFASAPDMEIVALRSDADTNTPNDSRLSTPTGIAGATAGASEEEPDATVTPSGFPLPKDTQPTLRETALPIADYLKENTESGNTLPMRKAVPPDAVTVPKNVGMTAALYMDTENVAPESNAMAESTAVRQEPEANEAANDAGKRMTFTLPARERALHASEPGLGIQAQTEAVQERFAQDETQLTLRYIGAVFKTYLLFETGEKLLMVDQHAAHERVLYDRLTARYQGTQISQRLLTSQMLRFTARDIALLAEMETALNEAGFDIEPFDATNIAVRAIPVILGENAPVRDLLLDVLDETQTGRGKFTQELLRRRVAQMACKHAIKAGDTLSTEDVRQLLAQMLATGVQPTCPHGRPIVTELSRRELEKRFKRIQ